MLELFCLFVGFVLVNHCLVEFALLNYCLVIYLLLNYSLFKLHYLIINKYLKSNHTVLFSFIYFNFYKNLNESSWSL